MDEFTGIITLVYAGNINGKTKQKHKSMNVSACRFINYCFYLLIPDSG